MKHIFANINKLAANTPNSNLPNDPLDGCQTLTSGFANVPQAITNTKRHSTILSAASSSFVKSISHHRLSPSSRASVANTLDAATQKKLKIY